MKPRLAIFAVVAVVFLLCAPVIRQNESYHAFSDARRILNVPNFWNVASNLPFAIVGCLGLWKLKERTARVMVTGMLLVSIGSGYYHLLPADSRLVWDRLPMTMVFMSLSSWFIAEGRRASVEFRILCVLLACGVASIAWWLCTGDLRPYALVQFGPILIGLPALWQNAQKMYLWAVFGFYGLAKCAEYFDLNIYHGLGISGHTCKHILAALSCYAILRWRIALLEKRPADQRYLVLLPVPTTTGTLQTG